MSNRNTPTVVIRAGARWRALGFADIWDARQLIWGFGLRDIKLRYKQTFLGVAWVVLQPLVGAGLLTAVFGFIAGIPGPAGVPYFAFAFVGQVIWMLFGLTFTRASGAMAGNLALVVKTYFPRPVLPLSTALAAVLDFIIGFIFLVPMAFSYGFSLNRPDVAFVAGTCLLLLGLGWGMVFAAISVRFRDALFIVPLLTQVALYGSPVAYGLDVARDNLGRHSPLYFQLYMLNPLASLIESFRWGLFGWGEFSSGHFTYSVIVSVACFLGGVGFFGPWKGSLRMSSSSEPAVKVRGLSKEYRIKHQGARITNLTDLASSWRSLWSTEERFWALNDATFDVARGEVVGIIGHNGAGKSTLLKILSRITEPTKGEAIIHGRLGSLLEVGTGFHPNLTGRENIFLNGSILGMRRREVARQFDAIVDFAGIERFLDTPVKRYSSGMYVRLAFAVAAHLQADVMIVDEVLAVGDIAFQQKCLQKMDDVAGQGRTILLVSHNTAAIAGLAKRCLVLKSGQLVFDGATPEALDCYLRSVPMSQGSYTAPPKTDVPTVTRVEIRTSGPGRLQQHGQPLEVSIDVTSHAPVDGARISIRIVDRFGRNCAYAWRYDSERAFGRHPGVTALLCRFPKLRLAAGHYSLRVMFGERLGGRHFETVDACPFEVVVSQPREGGWPVDEYAYIEEAEWSEGHRVQGDPPTPDAVPQSVSEAADSGARLGAENR